MNYSNKDKKKREYYILPFHLASLSEVFRGRTTRGPFAHLRERVKIERLPETKKQQIRRYLFSGINSKLFGRSSLFYVAKFIRKKAKFPAAQRREYL